MKISGRPIDVRLAALVAASSAVALLGCGPGVHVETAVAPDASFVGTTYRFMRSANPAMATANEYAAGSPTNVAPGEVVSPPNPERAVNPILESPISLREMRQAIERDLAARGYSRGRDATDFSVAYYVGAQNKLQVLDYGYGYPFWGWGWRWGPGWDGYPAQQVTEYQVGTLIIDVLDGTGRRLLWRGKGTVNLPSSPQDYPQTISKGVDAIMAKFPGHAAVRQG